MFRQKREKTSSTTSEKTCQNKAFVQSKDKLTQTQLEAIAAGGILVN